MKFNYEDFSYHSYKLDIFKILLLKKII